MKLKRYGLLIALLTLMPLLTAGTTVLNSRQLAPSPSAGDILFSSDGKNNEWRPPESVPCCDLQGVCDVGNITTTDVYVNGDLTIGTGAGDSHLILHSWSGIAPWEFSLFAPPTMTVDRAAYLPPEDPATSVGYTVNVDAAGEWHYTAPIVDTDTDNEAICWDDPTATAVLGALVALICPHVIPHDGTANYTGVYISTWTPDTTNVDTITIYLYVDGIATDSWTTNAGVVGAYGGAVSEAILQGHYCQIEARITTRVGSYDAIQIQSAICNVAIK